MFAEFPFQAMLINLWHTATNKDPNLRRDQWNFVPPDQLSTPPSLSMQGTPDVHSNFPFTWNLLMLRFNTCHLTELLADGSGTVITVDRDFKPAPHLRLLKPLAEVLDYIKVYEAFGVLRCFWIMNSTQDLYEECMLRRTGMAAQDLLRARCEVIHIEKTLLKTLERLSPDNHQLMKRRLRDLGIDIEGIAKRRPQLVCSLSS